MDPGSHTNAGTGRQGIAFGETGRVRAMLATDLRIDTLDREFVDLTGEIDEFVADLGTGLLCVFVPHATAGVAIFETGAGSEPDIAAMLERVLPRDIAYNHHHGSRGHGADHVLPVIVSPSVTIPIRDGRTELGVWQSVVLVDRNRDNRLRSVLLRFLPA